MSHASYVGEPAAAPHAWRLLVKAITVKRVALTVGLAMLAAALNPIFVTPFPTALIADDEPLLRERLRLHLARLWPALNVVAEARNGRQAVDLFEAHRAHVVFVTAYEQCAVQAFEQGALDHLVKPFDDTRLAETVQRLKDRLEGASSGADFDTAAMAGVPSGSAFEAALDRLATELKRRMAATPSSGQGVRLIPVEQLVYLRADEKYTLVVWEGGEASIRKTIHELADELDPERFAQIHRSVIVNLHQVAQVHRGANETAEVALKGRQELLPVSRSCLHVFRQM